MKNQSHCQYLALNYIYQSYQLIFSYLYLMSLVCFVYNENISFVLTRIHTSTSAVFLELQKTLTLLHRWPYFHFYRSRMTHFSFEILCSLLCFGCLPSLISSSSLGHEYCLLGFIFVPSLDHGYCLFGFIFVPGSWIFWYWSLLRPWVMDIVLLVSSFLLDHGYCFLGFVFVPPMDHWYYDPRSNCVLFVFTFCQMRFTFRLQDILLEKNIL